MIELLRTFISFVRARGRSSEPLDLFLHGHTIPGAASAANPGMGGPAMVEQQRDLEAEIRGYVAQLEAENRELRRMISDAIDVR